MLVVMDDVCNVDCQDVRFLELTLEVSFLHEEVHRLHGVADVSDIMVLILFKVSMGHLSTKIVEHLHGDMEDVHQVVSLEDLVDDEGQGLV